MLRCADYNRGDCERLSRHYTAQNTRDCFAAVCTATEQAMERLTGDSQLIMAFHAGQKTEQWSMYRRADRGYGGCVKRCAAREQLINYRGISVAEIRAD